MKKGGSLSAYAEAVLRTSLFDFSNHFSALLLLPELLLPPWGWRLDGESLVVCFREWMTPLSLDEELWRAVLDGLCRPVCRSDTER